MVTEQVSEVAGPRIGMRSFSVPQMGDSDALRRLLATANLTCRLRALAHASALLPGMRLEENAQNVDAARFQFTSGARTHESVGGQLLLDRLLRRFELGPELLKVVRDTVRAPSVEYVDPVQSGVSLTSGVRVGAVARLLADGYTLVVDGVDMRDESVAKIALIFERIFGSRLNINAYVGYSSRDAFGFHWDDHEVVILPLIGSKEWEICEPRDLSMVKDFHGATQAEELPVWSGILSAGDAAYIPRGWAHRARARQSLTMHLTVSIKRGSALSVVRTAACEAEVDEHDQVMSPMAILGGDGLSRCAEEILNFARGRFGSACGAQVARDRFQIPSRRLGRLSQMAGGRLAGSAWLRNPHGGGWVVGRWIDGRLEVGAGARSWMCSPETIEVICAVSAGSAVSADALIAEGMDPGLVSAVARSGIVDTVSVPSGAEFLVST